MFDTSVTCSNTDCPKAGTCYRSLSRPSDKTKSIFFQPAYTDTGAYCSHYLNVDVFPLSTVDYSKPPPPTKPMEQKPFDLEKHLKNRVWIEIGFWLSLISLGFLIYLW